jgi:hypothetical protein
MKLIQDQGFLIHSNTSDTYSCDVTFSFPPTPSLLVYNVVNAEPSLLTLIQDTSMCLNKACFYSFYNALSALRKFMVVTENIKN